LTEIEMLADLLHEFVKSAHRELEGLSGRRRDVVRAA
jgi:hypothetical protein